MNAFKFNSKIRASIRYAFIALLVLVPTITQAQTLSYFTISDIGDPKTGKPGKVKAGKKVDGAITARDEFGKTLTDFNGIVYLSQHTDYGLGRISPEIIQLVNGVWIGKIQVFRAGEKRSDFLVTGDVWVSLTDNAPNPHFGASNLFTAEPERFRNLLTVLPGEEHLPGSINGRSGQALNQEEGVEFNIDVYATDKYWNKVKNVSDTINLISTDPNATLQQNSSMVNSKVSMSVRLNTPGIQRISALDINDPTGITPHTSSNITVVSSGLHHFTISQINGPVVAGQAVTITIRAETANNSLVTGFSSSVNLTSSSGIGTLNPSVIGLFIGGIWSGEIVLTRAETAVSITARDAATAQYTGTSNSFNVLPGAFTQLQVLLPGEVANPGVPPGKTGFPADQLAGVQFDIIVRAVDTYWNLVAQVSDIVKLESTDNLALLPGNSLLVSGIAQFTVIMGTAGPHTITASDVSDPSKFSGQSSNFNVSPGTLDHFSFTEIGTQVAGSAFQLVITARDNAGSPVTGYNGLAQLQSSTSQGTMSPTQITFVDGQWNGQVAITRASAQVELTCVDFAINPHTGQSNLFAVSPNSFTQLQILLPGQTTTPGIAPGRRGEVEPQRTGDAFVVTVNAVDSWWNPVPSASGTVELTSTDSGAILPLPAQLQTGTVTFTTMRFSTPGNWTITANFLSNPNISSHTSPLVNVVSSSVKSFVFDPIASPQTVADTLQIRIRAVDGVGVTVDTYSEQASLTASTGPGTYEVGNITFSGGVWSGTIILRKAAQSVHLNIHDFQDVVRGNSDPFTVVPGPLARLQILLPGETATPGLILGKSGQPTTQIAGDPFAVEVLETDAWWNLVQPDTLVLRFSSSDPQAIVPEETIQTVARAQYNFFVLTAGQNQVNVSPVNHPVLTETYSSSVFYVDSGIIDKFVFSIINGQQTAGQPFSVRIDAINRNGSPVNSYSEEIILFASTGNGTISTSGVKLTDGSWQGELYVTSADSEAILFAADFVAPPNTHSGVSNPFAVVPDVIAGLQLIHSGQTATPGVSPGITGLPDSQIAGNAINVVVQAVDQLWNLIPDNADSLVISSTDSFAVSPDLVILENGKAEIAVTLRTAATQQLSATSISNTALPPALSDEITIHPDTFSQLLVLFPGESHLPGDNETNLLRTPGRSGKATSQTSGLPFTVAVFAVDNYFNFVPNAPADQIRLFVTDEQASISPADTFLVNGRTQFHVTLSQGGNQILRAIDESNSAIKESMETVVEVLVGGLHYEVSFATNTAAAGEPFTMQVFYKNAIGQIVVSGNQLVKLSAVSANNLNEEVGQLENATFNLEAGQRSISQVFTITGTIRIKVEDDLGTEPAYSDPLEVTASGAVNYPNPFGLESPKTFIEYYLSEDADVTLKIFDLFGNLVWTKEIIAGAPGGQGRDNNINANSVEWYGLNDRGQEVGNGGYILLARAVANGKVIMETKRKIVVLR